MANHVDDNTTHLCTVQKGIQSGMTGLFCFAAGLAGAFRVRALKNRTRALTQRSATYSLRIQLANAEAKAYMGSFGNTLHTAP